jgi:hypothetical protein
LGPVVKSIWARKIAVTPNVGRPDISAFDVADVSVLVTVLGTLDQRLLNQFPSAASWFADPTWISTRRGSPR